MRWGRTGVCGDPSGICCRFTRPGQLRAWTRCRLSFHRGKTPAFIVPTAARSRTAACTWPSRCR